MTGVNSKLSPEGIPWKDYKLFQLLIISPVAVPMGWYLERVWANSQKNAELIGFEKVPDNAIMYGLHEDLMTNYMTVKQIKQVRSKAIFFGVHGLASYVSFGPGSTGAYEVFRFKRKSTVRPFDQMINCLSQNPNRLFGIFTDSGGPYNRVKESVVKLALHGQRPVVPYRSLYSPGAMILNHRYPFPKISGRSVFGQVVFPGELSQLSLEDARNLLQLHMDNLKNL